MFWCIFKQEWNQLKSYFFFSTTYVYMAVARVRTETIESSYFPFPLLFGLDTKELINSKTKKEIQFSLFIWGHAENGPFSWTGRDSQIYGAATPQKRQFPFAPECNIRKNVRAPRKTTKRVFFLPFLWNCSFFVPASGARRKWVFDFTPVIKKGFPVEEMLVKLTYLIKLRYEFASKPHAIA